MDVQINYGRVGSNAGIADVHLLLRGRTNRAKPSRAGLAV